MTRRNEQKPFYFNPLPPHGGRRPPVNTIETQCVFQSTPSAWRETNESVRGVKVPDISIHSLRMEGDSYSTATELCICISIHSLRMEGDVGKGFIFAEPRNFNPLPPHGGRPKRAERLLAGLIFQSTPSAWRETSWDKSDTETVQFQSTPSAWRETPAL